MEIINAGRYHEHSECCMVHSMCGYSLRKSVIIISVTTLIVSSIALMISIIKIGPARETYSQRPLAAVGLLFSYFCYGIAPYQILITVLLLWTTVQKNGSVYISSLWYISHISIVFGYTIFFVAFFAASVVLKECVNGLLFLVCGALYAIVFGYFAAVVNSYSYMLGT